MEVLTEASEIHKHCYHPFGGVLSMVIPDGHVVQKCCKCPNTRTVHASHVPEHDMHKRRVS